MTGEGSAPSNILNKQREFHHSKFVQMLPFSFINAKKVCAPSSVTEPTKIRNLNQTFKNYNMELYTYVQYSHYQSRCLWYDAEISPPNLTRVHQPYDNIGMQIRKFREKTILNNKITKPRYKKQFHFKTLALRT